VHALTERFVLAILEADPRWVANMTHVQSLHLFYTA
jgi:hypothetical protein